MVAIGKHKSPKLVLKLMALSIVGVNTCNQCIIRCNIHVNKTNKSKEIKLFNTGLSTIGGSISTEIVFQTSTAFIKQTLK